MIRVFIVDDSFYVRDSWKNLIMQDPRTTLWAEAPAVDVALGILAEAAPTNRPDVVLLDMQFREYGEKEEKPKGIGTIRRILATGLDTRILCISDNIDPELVVKAINQGAHGYVDKHQVEDGLIQAIEQVYNGSFLVSSNIAEVIIGVVNAIHIGDAEIFSDQKTVSLSERREQIATLAFRYGMTSQAIADHLNLAKTTVDTHIRNIREDLGVVSRDDIIRAITARKHK
jgi:DNA-binding NarL/FixJ family response regulator